MIKKQSVIDTITAVYPAMTKSSKKVADFIYKNQHEAQYMSITSLAEECNVADATITRFCKKIGYNGYNEFKLALAKSSNSSVSEPGVNITVDSKITDDDSIKSLANKLFASDVAAIQESYELISEANICLAVKYLSNASKVFCFGQGGSGVLAKEAWARFVTVCSQFQCIEDSHIQAMATSLCTEKDVILFFSYSGATRDVSDTLSIARECGAKVILITHFPKCPAARHADIILLCGSRESPLHSGSIAAKMSQLFIIDVLYHEYCRMNTNIADTNRDLTSNALVTKLL